MPKNEEGRLYEPSMHVERCLKGNYEILDVRSNHKADIRGMRQTGNRTSQTLPGLSQQY